MLLHLATFLGVFVAKGNGIDGCSVAVNGQFCTQVMHFKGMRLSFFEFLIVSFFQIFRATLSFKGLYPFPVPDNLLSLLFEITLLLVNTCVVSFESLEG